MAIFKLTGKVVRFDKKTDKKLAMVVIKDADTQRHFPVWTPILSDSISMYEFLEALENNAKIEVEGWMNIQIDGRIMLRAYSVNPVRNLTAY